MDIKWHRKVNERGWYATPSPSYGGTVVVAEAVNTSQTGTEDYPWDWHLTDHGERILRERVAKDPASVPTGAFGGAFKTSGVEDTLRTVKDTINYLFQAGPYAK